MVAVRKQKPIQNTKRSLPFWGVFVFLSSLILSACNPTQLTPSGIRGIGGETDAEMAGKAYIYRDNPIVVAGRTDIPLPVDMGRYIDKSKLERITPASRTQLINDCNLVLQNFSLIPFTVTAADCMKVLSSNDPNVVPLQPNSDGNWIYPNNSSAFYQVNAMYHMKRSIDRFMSALAFIYKQVHIDSDLTIPPVMPIQLAQMKTFWFNYNSALSQDFTSGQLITYSQCNMQDNGVYYPTDNTICMGYKASVPSFYWIQDPSVFYHEMGHAFVKILSNIRNAQWNPSTLSYQPTKYTTNLGSLFYDEAGSLNEGLADYISYVFTNRTHMGEWAAGKFYNASRPMSEDDPMHAPGISTADDERLSYPSYLMYDPNDPENPVEDIHYAGQITSHYLVAFTEKIKTECALNHEAATNRVLLLLAETMGEMGDLLGKGTDYNTVANKYLTNYSPDNAYVWSYVINPPTYRKFYQIFAKNIHHHLTLQMCPALTKETSERLLDSYGLLLFNHYNDNGTSADNTISFSNLVGSNPSGYRTFGANYAGLTPVDEINRTKTTMVAKSQMTLANEVNRPVAYVIDDKASIKKFLAYLLFQGQVVTPTPDIATPDFNNSNVKISPGEVVGVIINLLNNSNSTMAGVHINAENWDHMKITDTSTGALKPCSINNFPLVSEGGVAAEASPTQGDCAYVSRDGKAFKKDTVTNLYPKDSLHPVCLVQLSSTNETKWVSQYDYAVAKGMSNELNTLCLNKNAPDFNPNECFLRFLPGARQAFYSKIDPQKTYPETLKVGDDAPVFSSSSILAMEVNKWVPPGTIFKCRLRAKFSNCSDCYQNPDSVGTPKDDYADYEYAGHRPYRVIDFEFTVID